MPEYICGTCKYYDSDECYCMAQGEFELYEQDGCDDWEDDNEPTEEEKEAQITDVAERENHRIEVEGKEIL